eukprot:g33833.t1
MQRSIIWKNVKFLTLAKYKERGTVMAEDQLVQRHLVERINALSYPKISEFFLVFADVKAAGNVQDTSGGICQQAQTGDSEKLRVSSGKGFWSEMLGVGDFYYELGVQIIEVCLALKHRNGGESLIVHV